MSAARAKSSGERFTEIRNSKATHDYFVESDSRRVSRCAAPR